jgi:hypothetical protein
MNFRDLQGSHNTWEKFFMTGFEFNGHFSSKIIFFENGLGSFQAFLILQI